MLDNYIYPQEYLRSEKVVFELRHENMSAKFNHLPKGSVISYEPEQTEDNINNIHIDVMLAAQSLHLKSVNGYSGSAPLFFYKFWDNPNEENRLFYFDRLTQEEIGEVVVIK